MKSIARFSSLIAIATLAISSLLATTNVVAQEVVKPPEGATVLSLADFVKKLSVSNDNNVNGSNDVYLKSSRSGSIYKIHISKIDGNVYFAGTGGSGSNDGAKIIAAESNESETLCIRYHNPRYGDTCLRYFTDGDDYYVQLTITDPNTKVVKKRFDKKPDPKEFSLVK